MTIITYYRQRKGVSAISTQDPAKMHEAYIVFPPATISVHIESIASFDNNVILGTRQGHLLMYVVELNVNASTTQMVPQLLQYNKTFSEKPIVQIDVIPEYKMLFSLSNGIVSVNDFSRHNFPLLHRAAKTKGATIFSLDVRQHKSLTGETQLFVRMCAVIKRKLQLWYWKHDQFLEFAPDIDLTDVPRAILWYENTICIGFRTEYVLYDISGQKPEKIDLFPTSSSRTIDPCMALINNSFAVAKDEFLIAVDPKSKLQELTPTSGSTTTGTVPTANAADPVKSFKSLAWSQNIQVLVWDEPYAIALVNGTLEVRVLDAVDSNKDTFIQTIPDLVKARFLICSKKGMLFVASNTQLWCIQAVEIPKQRQHLLQQKKFYLALQLTTISDESDEEKAEKKHQIRTIYAFDLFANKMFKESMEEFSKLETDPCDVIRLFPNLLTNAAVTPSTPAAATPSFNLPKLEDRDLEEGLLALIDYLTVVRFNVKKQLLGKTVDSKPYGKNLTPLLSIIDTTLLKCYLPTNDSLVAPLLRRNFCHFEESEKTLKQYQKLDELIILYKQKGHHRKALQLLQSEADKPGSSLAGHERTIQYLQHLGNENKQLLFEFAGWVLEKHPEDGLQIFTDDITEIENLARAEVLDYLLKNHRFLVVQYLEHIIHGWNEAKPLFHNILIQQYREKIDALKAEMQGSPSGLEKQKKIVLENTRSKLIEFLRKSDKYNLENVLKTFPYNDLFEERAVILGKLGIHEKVIAIYIHILGDVEKAAEYCESVYQADETNDGIYVLLIRTLLVPPTAPPYSDVPLHPRCLQPNTEFVLSLLQKNATKLNSHAVLQILPDSIPMLHLRTFLELALHHQLERRRKNQVLKGLLYAENLQAQEQRMHHESKSVLVTEFSVCPVCKKRFTNQSAFVRYPDGKIVHYSCQEKD